MPVPELVFPLDATVPIPAEPMIDREGFTVFPLRRPKFHISVSITLGYGPLSREELTRRGQIIPPSFDISAGAIDTGAEYTLISRRLITQLPPYLAAGEGEVHGVAGGLQMGSIYELEVTLCGRTFPSVEVMAVDLPTKFDTLIGMDILQHGVLHFDGPARSVSFDIRDTPERISFFRKIAGVAGY